MTPWVVRLIAANVILYFVSAALPGLYRLFMLVPSWVLVRPWTPITYMFLHGDLWHLLFNMIGLFFFGPQLELRLGGRRFLWLYFLSGIGGAALSFVFTPQAAIVGASGAVFGILLGYARYWPETRIFIWGVLPIQARLLVIIMAALSLYSGFTGAQSGVAHFAHLGGFAAGYLFLRWVERGEQRRRLGNQATSSTLDRVSGKLQREEKAWRDIDLSRFHEINRFEIERILAKVDDNGAESLTLEEREFMNRMAS